MQNQRESGRISFRCRECERERAPRANLGIAPNTSAVRVDDSLGDGETKANATLVVPARLPELLEEMRALVLRYAWSGVGDVKRNVAVGSRSTVDHAAVLG